MLQQINSLTKAVLYYAIALALAVGIAFLLRSVPGLQQRLGQIDIYMLTPAAAVLIMLFVLTRDGYTTAGRQVLGLHRLGLRAWPLAIAMPVLLLTAAYGLTWLFGIGRLDWSLAPSVRDMLMLLGMQIVFSATEEVGWRGYLLPHLATLGKTRALLLSGFCHGVWHLPGMLMLSSYHAEGNRFLVVALFLVTLTAAGVLYGYVRMLGDSLWPAVLTHALVNTTWTFWRVMTVAVVSAEALEYWAGETGIFSVILITLLAGWLLYRINHQPQAPGVDQLATAMP